MSQPRIGLLSESQVAISRWKSQLAESDWCILELLLPASCGEPLELVVTDNAQLLAAFVQTCDRNEKFGVVAVGVDVACDVVLPPDVTGRELQTACRLVLEIVRLQRVCAQQQRTEDELKQISERDPLTGLANRRAWDAELQRRFQAAASGGDSLCLAIIDLDQFKQVNSEHGYSVADDVLRRAANGIQNSVRSHDFVARLGGDEFGILLANVSADRAEAVTDRIRQAIQVAVQNEKQLSLTATAGVAVCQTTATADELFDVADANLRQGKQLGRNQTVASIA